MDEAAGAGEGVGVVAVGVEAAGAAAPGPRPPCQPLVAVPAAAVVGRAAVAGAWRRPSSRSGKCAGASFSW
jgi:hypothetical protein